MRKLAKILDLSSITTGWRYSSTGRTHYRRFICIGDIHGCYDQLIELLQKCNYNNETDIIISCGDLCDRGPNSVDVLRFFMPDNPHQEHNIYSVTGNHDDKLKRALIGNKVKIGKTLQSTINEIQIKSPHEYFQQLVALYLGALPHIIRLPDLNNKPCYVVHAGVDAKYPIDKQTPETCIYIRGIDPKNYFDESKGIWYDFLDGTYTVLSGHIVSPIVQPNPNVFCLDGGCCHGGTLRAMIIQNNKYEIVEIEGYKKDMKIPEQFKTSTNEKFETLIGPEFGVGNDAWQDFNLRWLRSMHIDRNDHVISVGFPKFMNIGEGCGDFNVSEQDLLDNKTGLMATLKIDGSLLIRYVRDGIVGWRTRGSLTVGLDNKDEIDGFIKKYPKLNHASMYPDTSLLFEWVSPKNQIVIKYDQPEIYLVGAVSFKRNTKWYENEFSLLTMKQLEEITEDLTTYDDHMMPCTEYFCLKNNAEIINLIEKLKTEKEIEGYVIRLNNEQELVKIKSDHYFILHALKSKLDSEAITDLYLSWGRPSFRDFENKFQSTFDYETWVVIVPAASSICTASQIANDVYNHIANLVEENRKLSRKDFALLMKQKYSGEKLALCFSLLDHKPIKSNFFKTIILQNIKTYNFSMFKKEKINNDEEE